MPGPNETIAQDPLFLRWGKGYKHLIIIPQDAVLEEQPHGIITHIVGNVLKGEGPNDLELKYNNFWQLPRMIYSKSHLRSANLI